jgi:PAS domain S-box-containing protein
LDPTLLAAVVDRAPDGVLLVDPGGRIAFANAHTQILFGYPPEELVGKTVEFLVPERFRGRHIGHQAAFHARPSTRAMGSGLELSALRSDGTELPVEISLSPISTENGMYVTAIVRDVSERKAIEEDRRRSEERYRLLAEQARDIIYRIRLMPAPPRVDYMGPAATHLTGFTPEDHYADPDLFLRMTDPAQRPLFERLMSDPDSVPNPFMMQIHRRDGMVVWLEHQFAVIRSDGRPIAIEGIARDTTARVLLEEERQRLRAETELQDERERIARELHDGVMQSLYGVGLNLMQTRAQAIKTEVQGGIEDAISALNSVIADVRAYVMDLPRERAHGSVALQLARVAADAESNGDTAVTVDVDEDLPDLTEEQMHAILQIAREALSNTLRHANASAAWLSLARDGRGVLLEVRDDGSGFDPAGDVGLEHLGLRNMRTRAEQLGADLQLESAPGAGTVVRLLVREPPSAI